MRPENIGFLRSYVNGSRGKEVDIWHLLRQDVMVNLFNVGQKWILQLVESGDSTLYCCDGLEDVAALLSELD